MAKLIYTYIYTHTNLLDELLDDFAESLEDRVVIDARQIETASESE